jgi:hypothetical protein
MEHQVIYVEVYSIQHYVIKFVSDLQQVGGFPLVLPISSTNKNDQPYVYGHDGPFNQHILLSFS